MNPAWRFMRQNSRGSPGEFGGGATGEGIGATDGSTGRSGVPRGPCTNICLTRPVRAAGQEEAMHHRPRPWLSGLLAALALSGAVQADTVPAAYLLKPAAVFTASDSVAHPGWEVLVEGERIVAVGPADKLTEPPGARVVELPGMTLLQGLMDL